MKSNANTHLTLDERIIIETGISNGSNKVAIAITLGKDNSTIGKEIKLHRFLKKRNSFNQLTDCIHLRSKCKKCSGSCHLYTKPRCNRRDRSPGACNGCQKIKHCRIDKYIYDARKAHQDYLYTLSDSRMGVDLTYQDIQSMASIIKPLIDAGQSPYHILENHPELKISEKTLYNYIEAGVFHQFGIDNLSLRRKVSRKIPKQYKTKPRNKRPTYYQGREYKDFELFLQEHPQVDVVEMDTVYNEDGCRYLQTFMFTKYSFMIAIVHENKTKEAMLTGIEYLYTTLGSGTFKLLFPLILTDRGTEFASCQEMEVDPNTGEMRTKVFFCDPMQSAQKPHVENNHHFIRYILPKGTSTEQLSQAKCDLMFSHINSTPRASLNDKTPFDVFLFFHGKEVLEKLHIKKIDKDQVILKPYLLK